MLTENSTIRIAATFNDDRTHRYMLRRTWDESNPKTATIIMSNASNADITKGDLTGVLIQNNLAAMGYSSVTICNLFSFMCQKLDLSGEIGHLTNDENTQQILEAVKSTDITIIAIGTLAKTYKKAAVYQNRLFEHLREYQAKVHTIAAPDGTEGLHPCSAKLRECGSWELVPFKLPVASPASKDSALATAPATEAATDVDSPTSADSPTTGTKPGVDNPPTTNTDKKSVRNNKKGIPLAS